MKRLNETDGDPRSSLRKTNTKSLDEGTVKGHEKQTARGAKGNAKARNARGIQKNVAKSSAGSSSSDDEEIKAQAAKKANTRRTRSVKLESSNCRKEPEKGAAQNRAATPKVVESNKTSRLSRKDSCSNRTSKRASESSAQRMSKRAASNAEGERHTYDTNSEKSNSKSNEPSVRRRTKGDASKPKPSKLNDLQVSNALSVAPRSMMNKEESDELLKRMKQNCAFTVSVKKRCDSSSDLDEDFEKPSKPKAPVRKKVKKEKVAEGVGERAQVEQEKTFTADVGNLSDSDSETEMKTVVVKDSKNKFVEETASKSDDDESSESEWEDVLSAEDEDDGKEREPIIPKEGVEITISAGMLQKRKDGRYDVEGEFRRCINRIKKSKQLNLHKIHLMCLMAHAIHVNRLSQDDVNVAFATSFMTGDLSKVNVKKATEKELRLIVRCYRSEFVLKKEERCDFVKNQMIDGFESRRFCSDETFVLGFVLILRTIGFDVRLVASLQPISMKAKDLVKPKKEQSSEPTEDGEKKTAKKEERMPTNRKKKTEPKAKKATNRFTAAPKVKEAKKAIAEASSLRSQPRRCIKKAIVEVDSDEEEASGIEVGRGDLTPKKRRSSSASKVLAKAKKETEWVPKAYHEAESDDSDFEPVPERNTSSQERTPREKTKRRSKSVEVDVPNQTEAGTDFWVEVFLETSGHWVCVDCTVGDINCAGEMETRATWPLRYVLTFDNKNRVKDVTHRYAAHYMSRTRRLRIDRLDPDWWDELFLPLKGRRTARDKKEDAEMDDEVQNRPLPATIGEFKSHPLYVLPRHLLKFEGIYPPDAPPLGYIRGEPIYSRDCVQTLHSRETWLKQARTVRVGEQAYKVVKARPKWNKYTRTFDPCEPLDIFGKWQTEKYKPPVAKDGKVPRNEYGNVEMFKPCMLPIGTVHLRLPGLPRVARKLGIDYAAAFIGWDFSKNGNRPAFDGFIVCKEFETVLRDAWAEQQEINQKREAEKREKRVYGNWRRLIRGVLIRERVKARYGGDKEGECSGDES